MSIRYEDTSSVQKGGFSIVFRLARHRGALAGARARKSNGVASLLVRNGHARPVLGERAALAVDPILSGVYVVQTGQDMGETSVLLERLEQSGETNLAYVAPPRDVPASRTTQTSAATRGNEAWRSLIKLPQAQVLPQWTPSTHVAVAAVDSGIDTAHPQLAHMDFFEHLTPPPRRNDLLGHGSHVAGLIGATPCAGNTFAGIAHDCVDVAAHRGLARPHDAAAYYRALRSVGGARIVNLSVGGEFEDPLETELVQDSLETGAVVVAAMGNAREMGDPIIFPAALADVIAVAAVDSNGRVAPFSSSGDHVMVAAPGVDIISTVPTYPVPDVTAVGTPPLGASSGTSMAAPIVSAVIARMLAFKPSLTRAQVIVLIRSLGPWQNSDIGHGIIDVEKLLAAL